MSKRRKSKKIVRKAIQCQTFSSFSDPEYPFDDPADIKAIQETLRIQDPLPVRSRSNAGRSTSLTPLREHIILKAIKLGLPIQRAANLAGLNLQTLYQWKKNASPLQPDTPSRDKCVSFTEKFKLASIHGELEKLKLVNEAAAGGMPIREVKTVVRIHPKTGKEIVLSKETKMKTLKPSWQAAMTLLERRYPERWGRIKQLEEEDVNAVSDKIKAEVFRMLNLVPSTENKDK